MPTTRKTTKRECIAWLENPQLSETGRAYALGNSDPKSKWKQLMTHCKNSMVEYFTVVKENFYDPVGLIAVVDNVIELTKTTLTPEATRLSSEITARLKNSIDQSNTIEEANAYISCLIIAYGLIVEDNNSKRNDILLQQRKYYLSLTYGIAVELLKKFPDSEFLTVDQFRRLDDAAFTTRSTVKKETVVIPKCAVPKNELCSAAFSNVKNEQFIELANAIECHCSFFKQKLVIVRSKEATLFLKTALGKMTSSDREMMKKLYSVESNYQKPTIAIRKYPIDACRNKDYLFQLFTKVCPLFSTDIKPLAQTEESVISTHLLNSKLASSGVTGYYGRNLDVFHINIEGFDRMTTVPVYFVNDNNTFYPDIYTGPTKQFFNDVMSELVLHNIFNYVSTYFNNARYVLNLDINITKLPFYKELPDFLKTPELQKKLTNYFYLFLGNLIHFAVANNIELPFKLSRAYIVRLFNIMPFNDEKGKALLISILLMEQPELFTKAAMKLLDNPTDEEALAIVSILEPEEELNKDNMFEYLYQLAYHVYFPQDARIENFFKGFTHYREFHETDFKKLQTYTIPSNTNKDVRLALVRKIDVYLSGSGLNYDKIKDELIPQIVYTKGDDDEYSFTAAELRNIPTNLNLPDSVDFRYVEPTITYWLIRILLDDGSNIPDNFKTALNMENLSNVEYHFEFVKLLLKTWTGVPFIMANTKYVVHTVPQQALPVTHTCFNQLDLSYNYESPKELYDDLITLILETGLGTQLAGGKKVKNIKANKNNKHGDKKKKAGARSSARKQKA